MIRRLAWLTTLPVRITSINRVIIMNKIVLHLAGLLLIGSSVLAPAAHAENNQAGNFDYYLLTLSWSPAFCLTHADNTQCTKDYGFVLHGLWPQYDQGGWPQRCAPIATLTQEERAYGNTLFPTNSLLTHEWETHGTCSGLSATAYLKAADLALSKLKIPAELEAPRQPLYMSAQQILTAFYTRNPTLPKDSIVAICRGKDLSEVRICHDKNLHFQSCAPSVKTQCRSGEIRIVNIR